MGLDYGFNEETGKWYAKGFLFIREYDTEEEMIEDRADAFEAYYERRAAFKEFYRYFADLGGRDLA